MTKTIRITEIDQCIVPTTPLSDFVAPNEFLAGLVAAAVEHGTATMDDPDGCPVTAVVESVADAATITDAIDRSISHTERVHIDIEGSDIDTVLADIEHDGYSRENDGSYDVWGTRDGDEWRLCITLVSA